MKIELFRPNRPVPQPRLWENERRFLMTGRFLVLVRDRLSYSHDFRRQFWHRNHDWSKLK